jgi:hypothetical protein
MTMTTALTNRFLKMLANIAISGIAIPAPPIIKAMTAPMLMPFWDKASPMGIADSARMYNGTPTIAATGIAKGLSGPTIWATKSCGI